jgi:hypothetical protein
LTTCRRSCGTERSRTPEVAEQAVYDGSGYFANNLLAPHLHFKPLVELYRRRFAH